ncbi:MAG: ABC transporter ATP-binding protein [Planctomycetes bacterium]|nr:ABC transporter ATP-binding protein [Planctomycetota bacterium]
MATTMAPWAMNLTHVSKMYRGKVHALRGIEMKVHSGEIFGLLGPNGAGKSTLVKILMTVIRATQAEGTMLGGRVGDKEVLRRVGYLPEHHRFPEYLTGAQVLEFYGAMSGVARRDRRTRRDELLDLVGMRAWADKAVRGYSKGMRQRIGIAQALMNNPELVVLDEPTDGVDPVGRRDIRVMLQRLRDEGRTVFLNSHLLSELEMVCDRVAILVQGKVVSQGTIAELTDHRRCYEIEAVLPGENNAYAAALGGHDAAPLLISGPGSQVIEAARPAPPGQSLMGRLATGEPVWMERGALRVGTEKPETVQPIIDALRARGAIIKTVRELRPSLEDLFMEAVTDPNTGRALAPGAAGKEATP